jgi:hypothetical protein
VRNLVRLEDAGLVRQHDCLNAVAKVELLKDLSDVSLDGISLICPVSPSALQGLALRRIGL